MLCRNYLCDDHKGRGCCGQCFTPFMCARPLGGEYPPCGCHVNRGEVCGSCGALLFVTPPASVADRVAFEYLDDLRRAAA